MQFERLIEVVAKLRGPDGCPWDKKQTRSSLKQYLIEELYELIDAIEKEDFESIKEELGDLLFQIVIQSQLAKEEGRFDINDVIEGITKKMIDRHPHVFGDKNFTSPEEVIDWWDKHKKEKQRSLSIMDGVPESLPALSRASRLQKRATRVGFDWERIDDVFEKLKEEVEELREAINKKRNEEIEEEIGDILFVMVRIANFVNVEPEIALRKTIKKFLDRFRYIEQKAGSLNRRLEDMTLEEMDKLWNEAKGK
jgi:tetrapyrrole methylase family protein/MazG family protein